MHDSAAGVKVFSDDGKCVDDAVIMRRALEYVKASTASSPSTPRSPASPKAPR